MWTRWSRFGTSDASAVIFVSRVPAHERSSYVTNAIAGKLARSGKRLIRACKLVNADPEVREIEKEFDSLTESPGTVKCWIGNKQDAILLVPIDQIRAVAKERLTRRIEDLSPQDLETVERGLREILELD